MFKQFLIRHISSPGFQLRVKNIYIPLIKQLLAKPYTMIHSSLETNQFAEIYKNTNFDLIDEAEQDDGNNFNAEGVILTEEQAVDIMKKILIDHEPQEFGTCVAHSMKNIHRMAAKLSFGVNTDFSEHDVYIDRLSRSREIDGGMNSSKAMDRMIAKGISMRGIIETAETKKDLETVRADFPDAIMQPFRLKMMKSRGYIKAQGTFEPVWAMIVEQYNKKGVRPFQLSITSRQGWWGKDVPTATGRTYGGHSAIGVTIPFMFGNKRAFFCIDSSYRRGTSWRVAPGVRIVTEDCWKGLGRVVRPVEYLDAIEQHLGGSDVVIDDPVAPPVVKPPTLTTSAAFGQSNAHVTAIQKALISLDFDIPAITTGATGYGYYGQQTADAVLKFHQHFAPAFTLLDPYWTSARLTGLQGKSFGSLSLKVMNGALSQR